MPRTARVAPGGMIFHVLNRGNDRRTIFESDGDYRAFLRVMAETVEEVPLRILAWCLMPNHWHLVLWPKEDGELGRFMQRLTTTHVRRWRLHRHSVGHGHLYQGTYKSFPVESDEHFYTICRYVERNALRAKLVRRAEKWPWGSLGGALHAAAATESPPLARWPLPRSPQWVEYVNRPQTEAELDAIRVSIRRGRPFGSPAWQKRTAKRLGLESTFRPRGRPRKAQ
jgi:REP-associated tyrosine transposase